MTDKPKPEPVVVDLAALLNGGRLPIDAVVQRPGSGRVPWPWETKS